MTNASGVTAALRSALMALFKPRRRCLGRQCGKRSKDDDERDRRAGDHSNLRSPCIVGFNDLIGDIQRIPEFNHPGGALFEDD